jgi:hypothetical protein
MEPASAASAVDLQLVRILARMVLRLLDQGQDAPSRESLSPVRPEPPETPETSGEAPKGRAR